MAAFICVISGIESENVIEHFNKTVDIGGIARDDHLLDIEFVQSDTKEQFQ